MEKREHFGIDKIELIQRLRQSFENRAEPVQRRSVGT